MKDYRRYLRAAGVKPIRGKLRTEKAPGSIELVWDSKRREYVAHVHEGETGRPKLKLVKDMAA